MAGDMVNKVVHSLYSHTICIRSLKYFGLEMNGFTQWYMYTQLIWQRQCIKIKQPLHAAYFSRKSAKQPFLDFVRQEIPFLQPNLPLVHHTDPVTNRDSSRVAEPHHFLTSGTHLRHWWFPHCTTWRDSSLRSGVYLRTKNIEKKVRNNTIGGTQLDMTYQLMTTYTTFKTKTAQYFIHLSDYHKWCTCVFGQSNRLIWAYRE